MTQNRNGRGIVLMLVSMAAFAIADSLVKFSSSSISPAQVMLLLLVSAFLMYLPLTLYRGDSLVDRRFLEPIFLLRYLAEISGMVGMVNALALVPLATVGAITQAVPIIVAVGAALFLSEKISWRRWTSIFVGFAGVLLIVQPGAEGFDIMVLWAVLAMISLSVRDLTTRMIAPDISSVCLATFTMIATIPVAVCWVLWEGQTLLPHDPDWLVILPMVTLGSLGYLLLTAAMRMAEVSVVTPFRYSRVLFLIVLGLVMFGEQPGPQTLVGAVLIIASGTYMTWREHQLKRNA